MKLRRADGTVHFSDLKQFSRSPAHYRHAMLNPIEATRGMRVGTAAHAFVLGEREDRPVVLYDSDARRGKDWDNFKALHARNPRTEILTRPEWDDARSIADAVLADPHAAHLLGRGKREVAATWTSGGVECGTDGVDLVGDTFLAEFKVTNNAEPMAFARLATNMLYHAQLAFYLEAFPRPEVYIIAVESEPPHPVVVFRMPPEAIELGRKSLALWLERLRMCEENDHWPGYTQTVVDFQLPAWMGGDELEEAAE